MADSTVSLVYVNYNCGEMILESLHSVLAGRLVPEGIVVVDNASRDGSSRRLEAENLPGLEVLYSPENRGFGGGCNMGIDHVLAARSPEAVWFLNPDTVASPDALACMVETIERHPGAGAVGSRQLRLDGSCEYDGGCREGDGRFSHRINDADKEPDRCEWITGASMLIDAEVFRKGLRFDERFFLYSEDVDLSLRMLREGYELWHDPRARITHLVSATLGFTSPMREYYFTRAKFLLARYHDDRRLLISERRALLRALGASYAGRRGLKHVLKQLLDIRYGWRERAMALGWFDAMRGKTGRVNYRFFDWPDTERPFRPLRFRLPRG